MHSFSQSPSLYTVHNSAIHLIIITITTQCVEISLYIPIVDVTVYKARSPISTHVILIAALLGKACFCFAIQRISQPQKFPKILQVDAKIVF